VKAIERLYWVLQITGWTAYGCLLTLFTYLTQPEAIHESFIFNVVIFITVSIGVTHLMRTFYVKKDWFRLRLIPILPRLLIASLFASSTIVLVSRGLHSFSNTAISGVDSFETNRLIVDLIANSIIIMFWNTLYFGYSFFKKFYYQEINNLSIESNLREVELKNLRSQLNPHFLFNSLNSIKALILIDPKKAKESLTILSSLLRSSLMASSEGLIPLSKEIELVRNYLQLEKMRFEERLDVQWSIHEGIEMVKIPPFVLQMMVENAVKHGISNLVSGGKINIVIRQNPRGLVIQVKNTGQIEENKETFGIGLENTKRRLDLQYKNRASLLMYEEEDMVVSQILLKDEG
jgi:two-component system LytT family sensor kinase